MSDQLQIYIFNEIELSDPRLIRQIREVAARVAEQFALVPSAWHDFLIDLRRDLDVQFVSAVGQQTSLPFTALGISDHEIDIGDADLVMARIADWFAYICQPIPEHITPYIRNEAKERFQVLASMLIAAYPAECAHLSRRIPANDNWPASPKTDASENA